MKTLFMMFLMFSISFSIICTAEDFEKEQNTNFKNTRTFENNYGEKSIHLMTTEQLIDLNKIVNSELDEQFKINHKRKNELLDYTVTEHVINKNKETFNKKDIEQNNKTSNEVLDNVNTEQFINKNKEALDNVDTEQFINKNKEVLDNVDTEKFINKNKEVLDNVDTEQFINKNKEKFNKKDTEQNSKKSNEVLDNVDTEQFINKNKEVLDYIDAEQFINNNKEVLDNVDTEQFINKNKEVLDYIDTEQFLYKNNGLINNIVAEKLYNENNELFDNIDTEQFFNKNNEELDNIDAEQFLNKNNEILDNIDAEQYLNKHKEILDYVDTEQFRNKIVEFWDNIDTEQFLHKNGELVTDIDTKTDQFYNGNKDVLDNIDTEQFRIENTISFDNNYTEQFQRIYKKDVKSGKPVFDVIAEHLGNYGAKSNYVKVSKQYENEIDKISDKSSGDSFEILKTDEGIVTSGESNLSNYPNVSELYENLDENEIDKISDNSSGDNFEILKTDEGIVTSSESNLSNYPNVSELNENFDENVIDKISDNSSGDNFEILKTDEGMVTFGERNKHFKDNGENSYHVGKLNESRQFFKFPSFDARIVGGDFIKMKDAPSYIKLYGNETFCGGNIIGFNTILTAAHCVTSTASKNYKVLKPDLVFVYTSSEQFEGFENEYLAESIKVHPDFNKHAPVVFYMDLAIITLKKNISFDEKTRPADLIKHKLNVNELTGKKCSVAGWGSFDHTAMPSRALKQINVTIMNQTICQSQSVKYDINVQICTLDKDVDTCVGDSGGGLFCDNKLVAITSFGGTKCASGKPAIYARVDVALDFFSIIPDENLTTNTNLANLSFIDNNVLCYFILIYLYLIL